MSQQRRCSRPRAPARHCRNRFGVPALALIFSIAALRANADDPVVPQEITIAATKQNRAAEDLNASSQIVLSEELESLQVRNTRDLARALPGVFIEASGSQLFPIVSMRGVTSAQDFYNPSLTIYVDGVPQLPTFTLRQMTDVERVELLRGPQGTLYGKSAQGGIINIVTSAPGATSNAFLNLGAASRSGYHAKGGLSGALIDDLLYGSATVLSQSQPGDLRNLATGHRRLGGLRSHSAAGRLRLAPGERPWELNLAASGECAHGDQDVYLPFDAIDTRTLPSVAGTPDPLLDSCAGSQSLTGTWLTSSWQLTAVTAWQRQHYDHSFPFGTYLVAQPERWQQNVQDVRLSTRGQRRRWDSVFGIYHQGVRRTFQQKLDQFAPATRPGPLTGSQNHSESWAVYTDGTWRVTNRFDAGAGVRLSRDRAETTFDSTLLGTPLFSGAGRSSENSVLGQVSAGYRLSDNWRTYARVAQGYKPTGFNLAPNSPADARPFQAETSLNYEIGARYGGEHFRLQAAAYHTHTRDMQLFVGTVGAQTLTNVGAAHASGAEFDITWNVLTNYAIGVDGSATIAEFDEFDYSPTVSYAGKRVPFVPRYALGAHVTGKLDTSRGTLHPGVDLRALSAQYFDPANRLRQPAHALVDLRLGWSITDWLLTQVYVQNTFDERYRTYAFSTGPASALAQISQARTAGLSVNIEY